jgi:2-oxoglutarate ferredoxin oxidoreductase subunit delta
MRVFGRTPIDIEGVKVPQGQVFIIPERCKGCNLCIQFCPQEVLQESISVNAKGYHFPEVKTGKETSCVNCEFCMLICPEFAIYTEEVKT